MLLSQRRRSVPDAAKQIGCAVPTTVLSETFRLSLFLVFRGGIGFIERLGAARNRSLTGLWTSPSNQSVWRTNRSSPEMNPGMDSPQTLKLLVVLDVRRRNELLSSKRSK